MMRARLTAWWSERTGAAAVEVAMLLVLLVPLVLNVVDMGYYAYMRMQVDNAAQAGAQAAYANCIGPPAKTTSTSCTKYIAAVSAAVSSTNLGTAITWTNAGVITSGTNKDMPNSVGTYCPNTTTNSLAAQTTTCSSSTSNGDQPATYARIDVSYNFRPIFPGATVASLFPATITTSAYQRLFSN